MTCILDTIGDELRSILANQGAEPVSLDPSFAIQGQFGGTSVQLDPWAYSGAGLDWARVARLRGGDRVQVVNAVFLPALSSGGPIFALELLVFGDAVHLFVADMVGSHGPAREALQALRSTLAENHSLEPAPDWGGKAFTDDLIFLRPGKKAQLSVATLQEPIIALAKAWAEEFSGPWASDDFGELRHIFLTRQRKNEPARPFLERLAGKEAVTNLADHYLYPTHLSPPSDT